MVLALSTSLVMAQEAKKGKGNRILGKVTKVDGANITVKPNTGDEKTFATDDKTTVNAGSHEGEKKAVSDLKEGETVAVMLSEDGKTATAIVIGPTGGGKKGKNK